MSPEKRYVIPVHKTVAKRRIKDLIHGMDETELSWVIEAIEELYQEGKIKGAPLCDSDAPALRNLYGHNSLDLTTSL